MAYNLLKPVHFLSGQSLATSFTSSAIEVRNQDNVGIQLHWTGAPVGVFGVQVSSDHMEDLEGNIQVAGNWVAIPLNPTVSASGSGDDAYIDLNQISAQYVRLVYTRTSGTGSVDAIAVAKGV